MNIGTGGKHLETVLLSLAAVLAPFVSWTRFVWLEGVFTAIVLLLFLFHARTAHEEGTCRFPFVTPWIPLGALAFFTLVHLVFSPVPYATVMFLTHLLVAMAWYYVLLVHWKKLPMLPVVLVWVMILVSWMLAQKIGAGTATPSGPFLNPNYTATVLLPCLGYFIGIHLGRDTSRHSKRLGALAAAMSIAGLLLTGSRSAMLGLFLLLIILTVAGTKRIRWVVIAVIVVLLLLPTTVRHRVLETYKKDPHAFTRIQIWESALRMGSDHPLLGVGPNLFYHYSPQYAFRVEDIPVKYGRIARKPHNEYIRSWAEGGIAGVAITFTLLFFVVRLGIVAWKEGRAGPALALGMVLYQAFFHDITEVFAPVLLGILWLSQLTPCGEKPAGPVERGGKMALTAAAVFLLGVTLWVNMDGVSRMLWQKGLRLMESDILTATENVERALSFNPIHPGAARDLARIRYSTSNLAPTSENRSRTAKAILRARTLNRLDTVTLRMEAALNVQIAREEDPLDQGLMDKALTCLEEAVHLEPFNALILFQRAGVYEELGRAEEALELVDRALELEPNYKEAHRTRIRYLTQIDPAAVPEAEDQLKRAVQRAKGYRTLSRYEEIILE